MEDVRIGLFGIGLDAYWPQFAGLQDRLQSFVQRVASRLTRPGVKVVNLGLIDSPPKAVQAGHRFRQEDVDLIFLYVTTYALSATVLPVVQRARVPVIVLNLQPAPAIDYASFNRMGDRTAMTGRVARLLRGLSCARRSPTSSDARGSTSIKLPGCSTTTRSAGRRWMPGSRQPVSRT